MDAPLVVFVETEPWEEEFFQRHLPGLDLLFARDGLGSVSEEALGRARVLSVFIHTGVGAELLGRLPALGLIATRSTGYDHVDLETCRARGILVANVPRYGENTVAEHTFSLMLALSRNVHKAWLRSLQGNLDIRPLQGFDLKGKTLGVVGAGAIGLHVIRIAKGFGMEVLAYDVQQNSLVAEVLGFRYVPLEELLREADIVTLHAPLIPATRHLVRRETLRLMKRGALLINTARGGLVDTEALLWALDEGILAGAGLDVVEGEELVREERLLLTTPGTEEKLRTAVGRHLLLQRENVVITPHIAFYSREALQRIAATTVANIQGFLDGRPVNLVDLAG